MSYLPRRTSTNEKDVINFNDIYEEDLKKEISIQEASSNASSQSASSQNVSNENDSENDSKSDPTQKSSTKKNLNGNAKKKKNYIYLAESEEDANSQQRTSILNLIFDGRTYTYIMYHSHKLKLQSILAEESEQAYKNASHYVEHHFYFMYQLFILSYALLEVDDFVFSSSDECLDFLYKLPYDDVLRIYAVFFDDVQKQNRTINQISYFYKLVDEPFFRMKYKVMKAFHCLPTEERCQKMNDAQWLWLYYNLEEDLFERLDENQDNLDYIGFYINSDAAKKIVKHNQAKRKQRDKKRKNRFNKLDQAYNEKLRRERLANESKMDDSSKNESINRFDDSSAQNSARNVSTKESVQNASVPMSTPTENSSEQEKINNANKILDKYFTGEDLRDTTDEEVKFNSSFEAELARALGTTDLSAVTALDDDKSAGDPFESEEDFLERLRAFAPYAGTSYGYEKPVKPPSFRELQQMQNEENISSTRPNFNLGEYAPGFNKSLDHIMVNENANRNDQTPIITDYDAFTMPQKNEVVPSSSSSSSSLFTSPLSSKSGFETGSETGSETETEAKSIFDFGSESESVFDSGLKSSPPESISSGPVLEPKPLPALSIKKIQPASKEDSEFLRKMNIRSMDDVKKYQNIPQMDQDLDYFVTDDENDENDGNDESNENDRNSEKH